MALLIVLVRRSELEHISTRNITARALESVEIRVSASDRARIGVTGYSKVGRCM